jgi:hypothetical protein
VNRTTEGSALSSPSAAIDACYECVSFAAHSEPDWARFRALFVSTAVLALRVFPEDGSVSVMNLDEYCLRQMRDGLKESGYTETVTGRDVQIVGDVAFGVVNFEMHFGDSPPVPAVDVFSFVRIQGRWLVTCIVSDMARSH